MVRIAIDMDEVMADTLSHQITWIQTTFNSRVDTAEMPGRKLRDVAKAAHIEALDAWMHHGHFFADIPVMPHAQEVCRALCERHEVWVATAAMDYPRSCDAKFAWLRQHFQFIPVERFVFCGDKSVVHADWLIDDSPRHFEGFVGSGLLYHAPHNANDTQHERVRNWQDIAQKFL